MKKTLLSIITFTLISCQTVSSEREIGYHPNTDPDVANTGWYLGTDTAIDVVLRLDKVWKNWDYEAMRPFFADSVRITTSRGERFTTADAYFDDMKKRDYNNFSWELLSIYSVDIKPNVGGEHVQAYFKNIWKDSLGNDKTSNSQESYYVVDGKVVWLDQFSQRPIRE